MRDREKFEIEETKRRIFERDGGRCQWCGRPVGGSGQLAHRIPQSKAMVKKYGKAVIHHDFNMRLACSLQCNSALSISNHPVMCDRLAEVVRESMGAPAV